MDDKKLISVRGLYPCEKSVLGYSYNEVLIEDGAYVTIHNKTDNTDTMVGPFKYIDDYHFSLNGITFHCDEYAEMLYRNNCFPTY